MNPHVGVALRRYFGWARRERLRDDDPTDAVGAPRRHAEVLGLRWGDIDLEGRTYTYEGKGGRSERRELAHPLAAATERWATRSLADRRPEALVFPGRWPVAPVSPS
jgi:integrase